MNKPLPPCVEALLEDAQAQALAELESSTYRRLWSLHQHVDEVARELPFDHALIQSLLLGRTALEHPDGIKVRQALHQALEAVFAIGIERGEVRRSIPMVQLTGCFLELCSRLADPGRDRDRDGTFFDLFWRGVATGRNVRDRDEETALPGEDFPQSPFFAI